MFEWIGNFIYGVVKSIFADKINREVNEKIASLIEQRIGNVNQLLATVLLANNEMKKELESFKQSEVGILRSQNQQLKQQVADTGNTLVLASYLLKREMQLMQELEILKNDKNKNFPK